MSKILELVGGPPASGKSTYIRAKRKSEGSSAFEHLDYDAMVVKEAKQYYGSANQQEVREHISMVYGAERSRILWGGGRKNCS